MKKCCACGNEILEKAVRCPYCNTVQKTEEIIKTDIEEPVEDIAKGPEAGPVSVNVHEDNANTTINEQEGENTKPSGVNITDAVQKALEEYPQGLLKYFSIVCAVVYGYLAITYLPYLNYSDSGEQIYGVFMIFVCAISCGIFLLVAFKCQKKYGLQLSYVVFICAIFKSILHLIHIQRYASYGYMYQSSSVSNYVPIIIALALAFACYYFMKKEDMLEVPEGTTVIDNAKKIPDVLNAVLADVSKKTVEEKKNKPAGEPKTPIIPGTEPEKVLAVVSSGLFLAFGVLYTINLAYNFFCSFSFLKVVGSLLSILICIAIWMIYSSSRKRVLDATGFTIVSGVTTFRIIVRIILWLILLILSILSDLGAVVNVMIVILAIFSVAYWCCISAMLNKMKTNAKGIYAKVSVGIFPIVVLALNAVIKLFTFGVASSLQSTANNINSTLNEYGTSASSFMGSLSSLFGLGYEYGYSETSSIIQSFLDPITHWIQSVLGYSQSPIIMVIAFVIPILEIILLTKVRSYMKK